MGFLELIHKLTDCNSYGDRFDVVTVAAGGQNLAWGVYISAAVMVHGIYPMAWW